MCSSDLFPSHDRSKHRSQMKRTQSGIWNLELSQEIMPKSKRARTNRRTSYPVTKIPRAIRTRGTPEGYYEIPVTIYRKVYFNMSTGVWPTNQSTGAQIGVTGYSGFGIANQLDNSHMFFGNGVMFCSICRKAKRLERA